MTNTIQLYGVSHRDQVFNTNTRPDKIENRRGNAQSQGTHQTVSESLQYRMAHSVAPRTASITGDLGPAAVQAEY